jgi:isopenicillin N synthase-like dioxygenase
MEFKIIDMLDFASASPSQKKEFGDLLVNTAKTMGFLILRNTKVSPERQQEMFKWCKFFFDNLTPEIRKEIAWEKVSNYGLAGLGAEALDEQSFDLKETYNIPLAGTTNPSKLSKDPKFAEFNQELLKHAQDCFDIVKDLMRGFALGCDLDEEFFASQHDVQAQTQRLLHYPSVEGAAAEFAVSPHTDYGTLTLVFGDGGTTFSVKDVKDGKWYDVPPAPGCAIVNISDLLSRWTNDEFMSNPHRVIYVDRGRNNYMTAFFSHPAQNTTVECLPKFVGNGAKYPPINAYEYLKQRIAQTYKV